MKTLSFFLSFGLLTPCVVAQVIHPALDDDPVFHKVLERRVEYPRYSMRRFPLYGRVYAGFHLDDKGKITNITILSPGNTQSGFENQVSQALSHMPSLNPRYAGDYALPVAFCYINRQQSPTLYTPINKLDETYLTNRMLLKEWNCTLVFTPKSMAVPAPQEVWGYYSKK